MKKYVIIPLLLLVMLAMHSCRKEIKVCTAKIEEVSDSAAQVLTLMSIVSSASTVYETEYFESRLPDQNLYRKTIYISTIAKCKS